MKKYSLGGFLALTVLGAVIGFFEVHGNVIASPCGPAGSCSGAISVDTNTNNVSFGTSTPDVNSNMLVVGSSSANYVLRLASSSGSNLFYVDKSGTVWFSGAINGGQVVATNVAAGQFGANTGGGNYSFPGNVGIGTTNPAQKLDVSGSAYLEGSYIYLSGSGGSGAVNGTGGPLIYADANNTVVKLGSTAGALLEQNYAGTNINAFSVNGNSYINGGNFGIGTTGPAYKLDVAGDINFTGTLRQNGSPFITGQWTTSGNNIYNSNSGNVGIGTSNPLTKAHVYGTLTVDAAGQSLNAYSEGIRLGAASNGYSVITFGANPAAASGAQANQWWIGRDGRDNGFNIWGNSPGDAFHISPSGNVGIGLTNAGYTLAVNGGVFSSGFVNGGFDFVLGNSDQTTRGNSGSSRALVKGGGSVLDVNYSGDFTGGTQIGTNTFFANSGNSYINTGNVGIGTATPNVKLEVNGSVRGNQAGALRIDSGNGTVDIGAMNTSYAHIYTDRPSFYFNVGVNMGNGNVLMNTSGGNSYINGGNVGVGTTNPGDKLDVAGNIRVGTDQNAEHTIRFFGEAGDGPGSYDHTVIAERQYNGIDYSELLIFKGNDPDSGPTDRIRLDTPGDIVFQTGPDGTYRYYNPTVGGGNSMIIKSNGNIGIGTTGPGYKLDIQGGQINASGGLCIAGDCKTAWSQVGGTTISATNVASGSFGANTGGGNYTFPGVVTLNGGSSSNWASLNIGGGSSINANGTIYSYSRICTGNNSGSCDSANGVVISPSGSYGYGNVYLTGSGNTYFNGGNVGIGTTGPAWKLDVSGDIHATGWLRTDGAQGWYSQTYGGGWYMSDTTWIRSYGGKNVYVDAQLRADGGLVSGPVGSNGAGTLVVSGAASIGGKLTVGTIDPVYTIGGTNYATYVSGMTGQKEETTGQVTLSGSEAKYVIDFNSLEQGSDLWLFSKATDVKHNFDKMTVLLTPSFNGKTWYRKDLEKLTLTIYGDSAGEVSYRLASPRFDSEKWTNFADQKETGFTIN